MLSADGLFIQYLLTAQDRLVDPDWLGVEKVSSESSNWNPTKNDISICHTANKIVGITFVV